MYISVDVEADGPIPGDYSMTEIGAVVVEEGLTKTFYGKLKPISDIWVPEALAISGKSREDVMKFPEASETMREFANWVENRRNDNGRKGKKERLLFVADNAGFDWMFVCWYFHHYIGNCPFGYSSVGLTSLYKGFAKDCFASFKHLRKTKHTHHPVDDAKGNAEALLELKKLGLKIKL